jgi:hypothetical protein
MTCKCGYGASSVQLPVVWDLGGQSNMVGQGAYAGTWPVDTRVPYFLDGTTTTFGPVGGLHGIELALGPLGVGYTGLPVTINKSAVNGQLISALMTGANWTNHLAGIAAISRAGTDNHFGWAQGEADASGPTPTTRATYAASLTTLLANVRAAWGFRVKAHLLLLDQSIVGFNTVIQSGVDNVNGAMADVVAADPDAYLVQPVAPANVVGLQHIHYDSPQLLNIIGPRFEASRILSIS